MNPATMDRNPGIQCNSMDFMNGIQKNGISTLLVTALFWFPLFDSDLDDSGIFFPLHFFFHNFTNILLKKIYNLNPITN